MKIAVRIFAWLAGFALLISIMSCGMGRQLDWHGAIKAGVCAVGVAVVFGLIAAALFGIDWIRTNVRIE